METSKKQARIFFVIAASIFVIGLLIFILVVISAVTGDKDKMARIKCPGDTTLNFTKAGEYYVFYEYQSKFNGEFFDTDKDLSGIKLKMTGKKDSVRIEMSRPFMESKYAMYGNKGISKFKFQLQTNGEYILHSTIDNNKENQVVLAIGDDQAKRIIKSTFFAIGTLILSIFISGVFLVIGIIKISKKK